ncbi:MAG: hypothetical protein R3C59_24480 [Planctomycetaceae bacterium]
MKTIFGLRSQWRDVLARIEKLERSVSGLGGIVDVLLAEDPSYRPNIDLGMNGQHRRKAVVADLFARLRFNCVIETGTYLGATTGYFATEFGVPVYSCELVARNFNVARRLLNKLSNVHLHLQDSRSFLRMLTQDTQIVAGRPFIYLDAHWYEDLPLADELDIIAPVWKDYVILVDDFQVPGDAGYGYDDYGPGKSLSLEYLRPVLDRHGLSVFFPEIRAEDETGKKRGYCIITSPGASQTAAQECPLLKGG